MRAPDEASPTTRHHPKARAARRAAIDAADRRALVFEAAERGASNVWPKRIVLIILAAVATVARAGAERSVFEHPESAENGQFGCREAWKNARGSAGMSVIAHTRVDRAVFRNG